MNMVKCPRCELNYMNAEKQVCEVCRRTLNGIDLDLDYCPECGGRLDSDSDICTTCASLDKTEDAEREPLEGLEEIEPLVVPEIGPKQEEDIY